MFSFKSFIIRFHPSNKLYLNKKKSIKVSHLFWRENGDVVLVDEPGLLLNHTFIGLFAELLTREPEQHVLLAELGAKKLPERVPPSWTAHQLVK